MINTVVTKKKLALQNLKHSVINVRALDYSATALHALLKLSVLNT